MIECVQIRLSVRQSLLFVFINSMNFRLRALRYDKVPSKQGTWEKAEVGSMKGFIFIYAPVC